MRNFDEINRLAVISEKHGGYIRKGSDTLVIGDVELMGQDALEFVIRLNQRVGELIVHKHAYRLGRLDAIGEMRLALNGIN